MQGIADVARNQTDVNVGIDAANKRTNERASGRPSKAKRERWRVAGGDGGDGERLRGTSTIRVPAQQSSPFARTSHGSSITRDGTT